MGLYDEIHWDADLPAGHPTEDRLFQTKSLDPCLEHYVVTRNGRLLLVGNGWMDETDFDEAQGIDVEFHGDIRLVSEQGGHEYLARFTHGTLEWIRPLAENDPWSRIAAARMKLAHRNKAEADSGGEDIERA